MIIVGDIGGTKTRLALFEPKKPLNCVREEKFLSRDYSSLTEIAKEFLTKENVSVTSAAFGIAGPIQNDLVQTTNLPWVIDAREMEKELKIEKVHLINDLESNAYGLRALSEDEFCLLNKGEVFKGNQALISAGTGLGEAGLIWNGIDHLPFPSEGGHVDFSPRNDEEIELLLFLQKKFGHVSYERLLSGPGIHNIYDFLVETKKEERAKDLESAFSKTDPALLISQSALEKKHKACIRTMKIFVSLYGAEAGNIALKFLARGGIFVGGGIAPKILSEMQSGSFMESFFAKGRFSDLLKKIPVKVVLNDRTALLGAAEYALIKE